jgi:hypothetical protein
MRHVGITGCRKLKVMDLGQLPVAKWSYPHFTKIHLAVLDLMRAEGRPDMTSPIGINFLNTVHIGHKGGKLNRKKEIIFIYDSTHK